MAEVVFHRAESPVLGNIVNSELSFQDGLIVRTGVGGTVQSIDDVFQSALQQQPNFDQHEILQNDVVFGTARKRTRVQDMNGNGFTDGQDLVSVTVTGNQGSFSFYYDNTTFDGDPASFIWEEGLPALTQVPPYYNPNQQWPNQPWPNQQWPNQPWPPNTYPPNGPVPPSSWPGHCPPQWRWVPGVPGHPDPQVRNGYWYFGDAEDAAEPTEVGPNTKNIEEIV